MKRLFLLLMSLVLVGACASRDKVDQLERRNVEQQQRLSNFEEIRPRVANHEAEIDRLNKRISSLEGRIEELQRRLEVKPLTPAYPEAPGDPFAVPQTADGYPVAQQPGMQQPAQDPFAPQPGMQPQEQQQMAALTPQEPAQDPAQELYDQALREFNQRNYQAAQATWKQFSEKYPDSALTPNAVFWQGESFYQMRDYPKAILSYQELISKFPKSPKYAAALLKQGISFIIINKPEAGRLVLNDVIKKFPNTPEAKRAEEFLSNAN